MLKRFAKDLSRHEKRRRTVKTHSQDVRHFVLIEGLIFNSKLLGDAQFGDFIVGQKLLSEILEVDGLKLDDGKYTIPWRRKTPFCRVR